MFQKKPMSAKAYEMGSDPKGNRFGGAGFQDFISPQKINLEKWKPSVGRNLIDILPYNATSSHPLVKSGQLMEGDGLYSLDIFVHRGIGPSGKNIPCLKGFGKKCPICDENNRLFNLGTEEAKKQSGALYARRRVVYVVHDLIHDKYGYWDTGYKSVEEKLMKESAFAVDNDTGAKISVMDWEEGMSVEFYGTESEFQGHKFVEVDRFRYVPRKPLSDEVLSHSVDLSTVLNIVSAEDMEKILSGEDVGSKPASDGEKIAEAAEKTYSDEAMEDSPKSEPVSKPVESKPEEAKSSAAPVEEAKPAQSGHSCPFGHGWGEADGHDECATCKVWEDCIG